MASYVNGDLGRRGLLMMFAVLAAPLAITGATLLPGGVAHAQDHQAGRSTASDSYGPARRPRHGSKRFSKVYRSADTLSARM